MSSMSMRAHDGPGLYVCRVYHAACGATMYVPVCSSWIIETSGTAPAATGVTAGVGIVTMGASSVVRAGGSVIKGMGSTIGGGQS